ncbi:MAG: TrbI/VirB10 family protein [Gammaproteobacteria bacterium]|nr:TrbI/VirB10 family protein [Gammaproteobacteria bacterium]
MAFKLPAIFTKTDAKSRVIIIFSAILALVAVVVVGARYLGGGANLAGQAKVAGAPSNLQSVPGGELSPEYYRALMQANAQASKQAQISGSSAVATLVNPSGQTDSSGNCTVLCPGDGSADVAGELNDLVKSGKLSQADADTLLNLAKNDVSATEYAAALDELVKKGKLTPEQARKLLETYKRQHENKAVADSAKNMDELIKSGKVPLQAANDLLVLQKKKATPDEYATEVNRMVTEGKISPDVAAQLLAQYTQQNAKAVSQEAAAQLKQMVKSGQISADVADNLGGMQQKNVSVAQYQAELARLVAAKKLTAAQAAQLLAQYQKQSGIGVAPASVNRILLAANATPAMQTLGKKLLNMQGNKASVETYQAELKRAVAAGEISQEQAATLLKEYQAAAAAVAAKPQPTLQALSAPNATPAMQALGKKLSDMQANKATAQAYQAELKRAVSAGEISPEQAAALLQEYQAAATEETGGDEASKLEQRLQEQQAQLAGTNPETGTAAGVSAQQLADAKAQAAAEAERLKRQRIQDLMAGMSGQAQSLIAAWQPRPMEHKAGVEPTKKSPLEGAGEGAGNTGKKTPGGTENQTPAGPPIIKAGTILFAVLETAVDSDYPDTPVMATIVQGKFKGAKLLGKLALAAGQDRVSLNFNLIDMEGWPTTKPVTAFAMDPDTARTVLASNVNYHYMLRYGSMFASSFVSGYASAIQSSGGVTSVGSGVSTATAPVLSPASKIAVGIGQVGTTIGAAMSSYFNTPTTVKVTAGVGIGILFMADVPA